MIRRAQAEALLKLAEALEECERNDLVLGAYDTWPILSLDNDCIAAFKDLNGPELRIAISHLYPKSEDAEC